MAWTNYHHHSKYCDGVGEIETHVRHAIQEGVVSLGFSSHSPVSFENKWSMNEMDMPQYLEDIQAQKEKHAGELEIYQSLEIDYFPEKPGIIREFTERLNLDYSIGSIHFVDAFADGQPWEIDGPQKTFEIGLDEIFDRDIQKVLEKYFGYTIHMLENDCPTILGHVDKIKMQNHKKFFFGESETWYQDLLRQTLQAAAKSGVIAEVNTRGLYKKRTAETYPGMLGLKLLKELHVPICLNSDAHHPSEVVSEYKSAVLLLRYIGFKELMVLKNHTWQPRPFDQNGVIW